MWLKSVFDFCQEFFYNCFRLFQWIFAFLPIEVPVVVPRADVLKKEVILGPGCFCSGSVTEVLRLLT